MADIDLSDITITDDELRAMQEAWDAKLLRLKHPYVFDLIKVLARYPKCPRGYVLDMLWRNRKDAGLMIPPKFEASAQRALVIADRAADAFFLCSGPPPSNQREIYYGQGRK